MRWGSEALVRETSDQAGVYGRRVGSEIKPASVVLFEVHDLIRAAPGVRVNHGTVLVTTAEESPTFAISILVVRTVR